MYMPLCASMCMKTQVEAIPDPRKPGGSGNMWARPESSCSGDCPSATPACLMDKMEFLPESIHERLTAEPSGAPAYLWLVSGAAPTDIKEGGGSNDDVNWYPLPRQGKIDCIRIHF